jgi:hypothetical protein
MNITNDIYIDMNPVSLHRYIVKYDNNTNPVYNTINTRCLFKYGFSNTNLIIININSTITKGNKNILYRSSLPYADAANIAAIANLLNMYNPPILSNLNRSIMYKPYIHIQAIEAAEHEVLNATKLSGSVPLNN